MSKGNDMKVAKTIPEALKILWKEKIFIKAKKFREIEIELEKRGYNFNEKSLLKALQLAKFLTRKGERGEFSYKQHYPFLEDAG